MDTVGNLPLYHLILGGLSTRERTKRSRAVIFVSLLIILAFIFFGKALLLFFGITNSDFMIAGGIILLLLGIRVVLGSKILEDKIPLSHSTGVVPLATPLIVGPGVITSIIVLVQQYGMLITLLASVLNLLLTYLFLKKSATIFRLLGRQGSAVISRIMGLILASIAVRLIKAGLMAKA